MKKVACKDSYGKGLLAYYNGNVNAKFTVYSNIVDTEKWDISTFFRGYEQMPQVERIALDKCIGRVLDIGAGTGSHSIWLQERNHNVVSIDISEGAVEVMEKRGVIDPRNINFFDLSDEKFNTLLLLMNGIGIVGTINNLPTFFNKAKDLLNEDGRIIMDSSNIIYLFMEEDGSVLLDLNSNYYGEIEYRMDFEKNAGEYFKWLFLDFDTLSDIASQNGFTCEKIYEDDHYLFLAELKLRK